MRFNLLVLALFLVGPAFAQVPASEPDRSAYLELMKDVYSEVRTMDAVSESEAERNQFIDALTVSVTTGAPLAPNATEGKSWAGIWPPAAAGTPNGVVRLTQSHVATDLVTIPPKTGMDSEHALIGIGFYVAQRLGESSAHVLASKKVVAMVHGGLEVSALEKLHRPAGEIIRVPSLYERWGISKFLVSAKGFADGRPRLLYVVPPSTQYLLHYATMLSVIGADSDGVVLDRKDQSSYRLALRRAVKTLAARASETKIDYVDLGYYGQWETVLRDPESPFTLVKAGAEVNVGVLGIGGRVLTVQHRATGRQSQVLLIKSDLAIWGESSAFIAEGAVELPQLKGLLFMGSAGGISSEVTVYGLSVPKAFVTVRGETGTANFVQKAVNEAARLGVKDVAGADVSVLFDLKHGNTFSPMEQDKTYLFAARDRGLGSLDVEQSLVAEVVKKHNLVRPQRPVQFGAVNLITDRPAHILDGARSAHDLDTIDFMKKSKARLGAVKLALEGMSAVERAGNAEETLPLAN